MAELTLVLGSKNYCLWPISAWLCLRAAGLEFDEIILPFGEPDSRARFLEHHPTGRVPVLKHGDLVVWDSAAVCEYVAELAPEARLLPEDRSRRAIARSVVAEMHAHKATPLHDFLPGNARRRVTGVALPQNVKEVIDRMTDIWVECRRLYGQDGPFLFGHFTVADAVQAHMVNRFVTYDVALDPVSAEYRDTMLAYPPLAEWNAAAQVEVSSFAPSDKAFPGK